MGRVKLRKPKKCARCGTVFDTPKKVQTYCSQACYRGDGAKVKRRTKLFEIDMTEPGNRFIYGWLV